MDLVGADLSSVIGNAAIDLISRMLSAAASGVQISSGSLFMELSTIAREQASEMTLAVLSGVEIIIGSSSVVNVRPEVEKASITL